MGNLGDSSSFSMAALPVQGKGNFSTSSTMAFEMPCLSWYLCLYVWVCRRAAQIKSRGRHNEIIMR